MLYDAMLIHDHLGLRDFYAMQAMRMHVLLPSGTLQLLQPLLGTSTLSLGFAGLCTVRLSRRPLHPAQAGWAQHPLACPLFTGGGICWDAASAAARHHMRVETWDAAAHLLAVCLA